MGSQLTSRGQIEASARGHGGRSQASSSRDREQRGRGSRSEVRALSINEKRVFKSSQSSQVQFSVSGVGLKQHSQEDRRSGVNSRISMNGPLHWGEWVLTRLCSLYNSSF